MVKRRQIRLSDQLDEALKTYADTYYRGNVNMAIGYILEEKLGSQVPSPVAPKIAPVLPSVALVEPSPMAATAFDAFDQWADTLGN